MSKLPLPIDSLIPQIVEYIQSNTVCVLQAEPGAGKTTRVPAGLLDNFPGQILVLEPRRLAARLAARRVAEELNQPLGETVGYQVRFEKTGGRKTRLWYLTEGVLTRNLISDRQLRGVSVVILDEFHERHLETDLALALLRKLCVGRPDLRLLLMSATLETEQLTAQLRGAAVIKAPGRTFPVSVRYKPHSADPLETQVAAGVSEAAAETTGHILVFLPGAAEIRRAVQACEPVARRHGAIVFPLHGDLPADQQDEAVQSSKTRKIICSTNVAESSVTIDGIEAVVDSGLARVLTQSPWGGLPRLHIQKVSQSAAIQRAGRAGRTRPGIAIRLFSESDFVRRPKHLLPEILRSDLAPMLLQLASADIAFDTLPWLEPPPVELVFHAEGLLQRLGAIDCTRRITNLGRAIAGIAVHPRVARFVIAAAGMGARSEACDIAAKLSAGHFRPDSEAGARFTSDLEEIAASRLDYSTRRLRDQILKSTAAQVHVHDEHALEKAFLLAYPDRVARSRGETLLLCDGGSARLHPDSLSRREFLVAIEAEERSDRGQPLVRLNSRIQPDWLLEYFPDRIETHDELYWNRESERVEQVSGLLYDKLVIDETRSSPADLAAASDLLVSRALEAGVQRFVDQQELQSFLRRVRFAIRHAPDLEMPQNIEAVALRQLATGLASFRELREATRDGRLIVAIEANLPMRLIDELAPTHVVLPNGRRARIEYQDTQPPSVSSRLQDFFGMTESPCVARGTVPLVVQLLAPNHRPMQVTTDLPSFWKNLYPQLRRELGRRYPKHAWPEDPMLVVRSK